MCCGDLYANSFTPRRRRGREPRAPRGRALRGIPSGVRMTRPNVGGPLNYAALAALHRPKDVDTMRVAVHELRSRGYSALAIAQATTYRSRPCVACSVTRRRPKQHGRRAKRKHPRAWAARRGNRPGGHAHLPVSVVSTTRAGKRWALCPGCFCVASPLAAAAARHRCAQCSTEFTLAEDGGRTPWPSMRSTTPPGPAAIDPIAPKRCARPSASCALLARLLWCLWIGGARFDGVIGGFDAPCRSRSV